MTALIYRARFWDFEDWITISVDGEASEDSMEHMQTVLNSALGSAPRIEVQMLNDEGDWEDLT